MARHEVITSAPGPARAQDLAIVAASAVTFLAVRCGLLAFVVDWSVANIALFSLVPTVDPGDWYATPSVIFVGLIVLLTWFGARASTGGAPLVAAVRRE